MKAINWVKANYVLVLVILGAAVLRFFRIDYQSVWLDEIHTLNEANPALSLSGLYTAVLGADPHPPLYFILLHFVFAIFGYSTFVLRMLSAVLGVAGVWAIYNLGKEMMNKNVGLFAALLLAVNYFHLTFSQEGRMYSLTFLTTTVSFYFLVRFIKESTVKSALFFGFSFLAMIYCHLAALFVLVAQVLILLYFLVIPYNTSRKKFFSYCLAAGATLILYLPNYEILKKASERTSIWIPRPTLDVYTQIFKDFFGQSEGVLFFVTILALLFFVQASRSTSINKFEINPTTEPLVFCFLIFMIWISFTLLLPLVRSYTSLPMIVNRYFITILPAILIMLAIGLSSIENRIIRTTIISIIVIFSLTDIIIVKKYYTEVSKTQFREVTNSIKENNSDNDVVVTSLGWYFPFFLNNDKVKTTIIDKPLDVFISAMIQDSTKRVPFWHVEAEGPALESAPNAATQKYLDENFVLTHDNEYYRAWSKYYALIPNTLSEMNISNYNLATGQVGDLFRYYLDRFDANSKEIRGSGWAFFNDQDANTTEIELFFTSDKMTYRIPVYEDRREDLAPYFKIPHDLDHAGFQFKIMVLNSTLLPGKYQLGIILKNKGTGKEGVILTNNFYTKA